MFADLIQHSAMLISLTFIYGIVREYLPHKPKWLPHLVEGLIFGGFAILNMQITLYLSPGVFFDLRSVMISLAGVFGGWTAALAAAVIVAVYRLSLGGVGAWLGVEGAFAVALCGYGLYRLHHRYKVALTIRSFAALGIALWVSALFSVSLIPTVGVEIAQRIAAPLLPAYIISTILVGSLIVYQRQNHALQIQFRESESRFRSIFNTQSQFVLLLTPEGTLLEINQTALSFGNLTREEVIGKYLWDLWEEDDPQLRSQVKAYYTEAAQGKSVRQLVEIPISIPNGVVMSMIDFSITPIFDEHGQVNMLIVEGRDVTAQKQLEQQALVLTATQERSKMVERVMHDVAHDLRTPITILMTSAYLSARTTDPDKRKQQLVKMEAQSQRIKVLLEDLFDAARLEAQQLELEPIHIHNLIQDVIDECESVSDMKHLMVEYHPEESISIVQGNALELRRALVNLLMNAITHTYEYGAVIVFTQKKDDHLLIEIQDSGEGISADDLPYVFDPFYRGDKARSAATGGIGLGLSIAKRIVEGHNGSIKVESEVGSGTTVKIYLPVQIPLPETS